MSILLRAVTRASWDKGWAAVNRWAGYLWEMNSSGSSTWLIKGEVCILKITLSFPLNFTAQLLFLLFFFHIQHFSPLLLTPLPALPTSLFTIDHLTGDLPHFLQFFLFRMIPTSESSFQEFLIPTKSWRASSLIPTSNHTHGSCIATSIPQGCHLLHPIPELWTITVAGVLCLWRQTASPLILQVRSFSARRERKHATDCCFGYLLSISEVIQKHSSCLL